MAEARISNTVAVDSALGMVHHEIQSETVGIRIHLQVVVEFGEIVWARIPITKKFGKLDHRLFEVVRAGKANDSDEHIGLDHEEFQSRGAK